VSQKPPRVLLIDGDTLIYEATAATEYETQWEPWLWTLHGNLDEAIAHLDNALKEIQQHLDADECMIALSDEQRWRPQVMPTYKSNRKGRKPTTYKPLREYVHEKYNVYQRPMLEGDDVLGVLVTHPKLVPGEKIVVSLDKDMKSLPGRHLNYMHARGEEDWEPFIRTVTVAEADYFHMLQTLTGDATDGYKGCPGMGPVSAAKLLDGLWGRADEGPFFPVILVWPHVVEAYRKKGLGEEIALQNARVARICRWKDYNYDKKEVILWTPPSLTA